MEMAKRYKELLGALEVERAKPKAKPYRLADGGGLYLWVPASGVKVWQFRYRHGGKPQTATLGKVSKVQGLAWARSKADEARSRVEAGDHLTRVKAVKHGVGAILRAADKADVGKGVRRAHYIAAFTAQRIGEIVPATWGEVDMQSGAWSIPRERMKRKDAERGPHVVPIPPRLLAMMK